MSRGVRVARDRDRLMWGECIIRDIQHNNTSISYLGNGKNMIFSLFHSVYSGNFKSHLCDTP